VVLLAQPGHGRALGIGGQRRRSARRALDLLADGEVLVGHDAIGDAGGVFWIRALSQLDA
jgi:hypothetical protein